MKKFFFVHPPSLRSANRTANLISPMMLLPYIPGHWLRLLSGRFKSAQHFKCGQQGSSYISSSIQIDLTKKCTCTIKPEIQCLSSKTPWFQRGALCPRACVRNYTPFYDFGSSLPSPCHPSLPPSFDFCTRLPLISNGETGKCANG